LSPNREWVAAIGAGDVSNSILATHASAAFIEPGQNCPDTELAPAGTQ
jgi:hypothetical protein